MYNENRSGPIGQNPEEQQIYFSKLRLITIYRNKLFAIREVDVNQLFDIPQIP